MPTHVGPQLPGIQRHRGHSTDALAAPCKGGPWPPTPPPIWLPNSWELAGFPNKDVTCVGTETHPADHPYARPYSPRRQELEGLWKGRTEAGVF